jgi:class 3 adenylate cyclase
VRASAQLRGEQRYVTVLFVDVVGSTSLAEQLGVERWSVLMNGYFDRIAPIIYRYEGTIAHMVGATRFQFKGGNASCGSFYDYFLGYFIGYWSNYFGVCRRRQARVLVNFKSSVASNRYAFMVLSIKTFPGGHLEAMLDYFFGRGYGVFGVTGMHMQVSFQQIGSSKVMLFRCSSLCGCRS